LTRLGLWFCAPFRLLSGLFIAPKKVQQWSESTTAAEFPSAPCSTRQPLCLESIHLAPYLPRKYSLTVATDTLRQFSPVILEKLSENN